ncbi:MAG: Ig-like domain-containing protein, partial [Bacillaceae bacterium]|nr:Ig-like domain-containing protein [Bacillaceae bacterium]
PIVLGTAEANATIELRLENENHFEMANFTASPNGTWAYAVTEPLLEGTYTVTATASDLYGNEAKEESEFTLKLTRPIEEVAERKIEVVYGTNLAEATQQLGNKIDVTLADTNVVEVSVDWELDSPQTYSGTEPGVYTFTGTLTNLAEINVEKPDHIIVKGEVKVLPGIITSVPKQQVTVPYGTSLESAKTQLNTTVTVNLENGHTYAGVPVQWQDNQAYDSKIPGTYTVTGELHLYQSDAITNLNNVIALAEITVEKANVKQIEDILLTVPFDTNKEEALQQLENKVTIELENGDKVQVDVQWNGVSTPAYDGTKPGAYEFKGTITLPNFVNPESHSNVNGIITVLPKETVSITSVENVEKTIAYETSLEDARKALGDEVVVTLEDGSTATVAITWSSQSHPTYQPDVPGAYVFTGTFGEFVGSIDNWHNIQPPTGTIFVQTVSIESVPNLYKEVKIGTSLPEAIHTLGTEVEVHLSNEKTALIPVTWSEQAIPTYDPATPGVYEFQATFGTLPAHVDNKDGINAPTGTVKILNKEANIVSFSFNEQTGPAIIDGDKKEIHIEVEYGTDVTSLIASYKVSKNVTSVTVASQEQTTNVTSNDYTHGVVYTVVAEDGTVAHWTIFVKVQEKTATPTINEPVRAGDTVVSGTAEPFAVIEVVILDIVIGETTANEDGEWSILATNLSKDDAVKVTAQLQGKVKSDRATTIVESIEATLTLNVTPTTIVADGVQTSTLTAVVKDSKGNVIPNVFVSFEVELGSLSSETAVTDEDGQAIVTLTAPRIESVTSSENVVKVTAVDAKLGIDAEENVVMTYQPPMITGQVLVKNEVIANAAVWIEVDGVKYETVTNENGEYTIFVPKAGEYVVFIKLPDGNGTVFTQKAFVGASSTGETFQAERKITGQLLLESKNVKSLNEMIEGASYQIAVLNDLEGKLAISIDENGIYELTGFDQNEEYDVVISLKVGDISLAGKMFTVFTGKDGQIIIQDELIDPFGIITDVDSGELIEGAVVKLYWADTQLNKDLGRTPHTLVELPILPNFDPNQNKNPQISTEMREYTLEIGNYAWMVFADGDYYITAEKEGYELFDSRNDLATDVVYGDSYIRDGIIHVGQTIVRYDFEMKQTVVVVEEPVVPVEEEEQEVVDPILPEVVTPPTSNEGTSDEVTQPADEETAPANEETKQPADETKAEDEKQTENELPNTATNTYNILLFGLLLISLGGLLLMRFGGRRIVE